MFTAIYLSPLSIMLAFTLVLAAFAYPHLLLKLMAPRMSKLWISRILNDVTSVSLGMGLTNWYVRMVPYSRKLVYRSGLAFGQPMGDAIIASGVLLAYVVTTASSLFNTELWQPALGHANTVERFVIGNKRYSYNVRPLSSVTYTKLVLLSSIHFLVEGFSIGSSQYGSLKLYFSTLVHQFIMACVMGVLALQTGCGAMKVTKIALLFVSALPLGIMGGLATGEEILHWITYMVLGTVMSLASGYYLHVMFDSVVLPELWMLNTGATSLRLFLAGPVIFVACVYIFYDM
ncbi:unnamed protein product [Ixodes persulcatus]